MNANLNLQSNLWIMEAIMRISTSLASSFLKPLLVKKVPLWVALIIAIPIGFIAAYLIFTKIGNQEIFSTNLDEGNLIEEQPNLIEHDIGEEISIGLSQLPLPIREKAVEYAQILGTIIIGATADMEPICGEMSTVYEITMQDPASQCTRYELDLYFHQGKVCVEEIERPISLEILKKHCPEIYDYILFRANGDPEAILLVELSERNSHRHPGTVFRAEGVFYEYKIALASAKILEEEVFSMYNFSQVASAM